MAKINGDVTGGRVSMDISHTSTLSNYTDDEVREAQKDAGEITSTLRKIGDDMFKAIELMYDFEQSRKYKALGFDTANAWLRSEGFAPSTFMKYLALYKTLSIRLGIPVKEYRYLDIGKVVNLKILADAGAERVDIEDSIIQVTELVESDLIISTNDKIRKLKNIEKSDGKGDSKETSKKNDEIKNVLDDLDSGAYKIVKVTSKDRNADPRYNMEKMINIKGVSTKWYYNKETEEFIIVVN